VCSSDLSPAPPGEEGARTSPSPSMDHSLRLERSLLLEEGEGERERERLQERHFAIFKRLSEIAWLCSMGLGIMAFGVELVLIVWVKLLRISFAAAVCGTVVTAPLSLVFLVVAYFLSVKEGAVLSDSLLKRHRNLEFKLNALTSLATVPKNEKDI